LCELSLPFHSSWYFFASSSTSNAMGLYGLEGFWY
jgi:hypothetical protein